MSAELDMSQYLDLFLQEADEQLEVLEQETLKLEREPTAERLQVIFRAAHTLKGSSRAMGFSRFAELTHEMENVLDQLRQGSLAVTSPIADALLACLDTLAAMRESIGTGQSDQIESGLLVAQLRSFVNGGAGTAQASSQPAAGPLARLPKALEDSLAIAVAQSPVFRSAFVLRENCAMKFVRAFMAISIVEEHGELLASLPDRARLEEDEFDNVFELFFHSACHLDELQEKFLAISEVDSVQTSLWDPGTMPEPQCVDATGTPPPVSPSPAQPSTPASPGVTPAKKPETNQTVRVDVARLDSLMNLVGELVIDRTRIAQIGADLAAKYDDGHVTALGETVSHIARITTDLQDQIMKARMMPIETVFNRLPRVVRDLAQKLGKSIRLELAGGETELDRSVLEVIGDPLIHIIRNSVDHGIEGPEERQLAGKADQGVLIVSARHHENHIVIEVEDDGRGIDVGRIRSKAIEKGLVTREAAERLSDKEALQFVFASGLSTATTVSEVSGRGVGMDIVRSNLQRLGGIIDIDTSMGRGTRTTLRLPLTLAIIRGLMVRVNGVVYVIPLGSVVETLIVSRREIQHISNREVILIRGVTTPLVRLRRVFCGEKANNLDEEAHIYVVIVGLAEQRVGLVVDSLIGEQEVVIKSLSRFCGEARGVSGATILGDGNVALIVDVNGLVQLR